MAEKYKSKLMSLLESLQEKAKTPADAKAESLALFVVKDNWEIDLILFDVLKLLSWVRETDYDDMHAINMATSSVIVGYIKLIKPSRTAKSYGAWMVGYSAADGNYGPMMYDIAMSLKALIPDRVTVSPTAFKVWDYYHDNRKDVEKKPLDNVRDPKTKTKEDDAVFNYSHGFTLNPEESPLNYAYFSSKSVSIGPLMKKASASIDQATKFLMAKIKDLELQLSPGSAKKEIEDILLGAAMEYFEGKYEQ